MQIPVNSNRLLMPIIVAQACCCLTSGQVGPENQHMSSFTILWYPLTMADVIDTKSKTHDLYVFAGCLLYSPHWCKKNGVGQSSRPGPRIFGHFSHELSYLLGYPILNNTQMKPSKPVTKVCPDQPISAARKLSRWLFRKVKTSELSSSGW